MMSTPHNIEQLGSKSNNRAPFPNTTEPKEGQALSCPQSAPNPAVEPTPYSLRYASASGRGSPLALGGIRPGTRRNCIVANEIEREPERVLTEASRASVWILWYFKRGTLTLVTAPLFLFLGYCIAISAFGAVIQGLALLQASYAVFGFIGAFMAISFGWVPVILPPILYFSLTKNLPGLWLRPDASKRAKVFSSLAVIVLLPLAAYLIYHGVAWGIGWIADRDPCAAFSAGVTGSKPPVNCP